MHASPFADCMASCSGLLCACRNARCAETHGDAALLGGKWHGQWPIEKFPPNQEEFQQWWGTFAAYERIEDDVLNRVLPWLREQGVESIGVVGFCWGGLMVMLADVCFCLLGAKIVPVSSCGCSPFCAVAPLHDCMLRQQAITLGKHPHFNGVAEVHGARLTRDHAEQVQCPVALLPANDDPPADDLMEVLATKPFGAKCVHRRFDDMFHGFCAARGDWTVPEQRERAQEAMNIVTDFFKATL